MSKATPKRRGGPLLPIDKNGGQWIEDLAVGKLAVMGDDGVPRITIYVDEQDNACIELFDTCGHEQLGITAYQQGGVSLTFRCPPRERCGVDYVLGLNTDRDGHAEIAMYGKGDARKRSLKLACDCEDNGVPSICIYDGKGAEVFSTRETDAEPVAAGTGAKP